MVPLAADQLPHQENQLFFVLAHLVRAGLARPTQPDKAQQSEYFKNRRQAQTQLRSVVVLHVGPPALDLCYARRELLFELPLQQIDGLVRGVRLAVLQLDGRAISLQQLDLAFPSSPRVLVQQVLDLASADQRLGAPLNLRRERVFLVFVIAEFLEVILKHLLIIVQARMGWLGGTLPFLDNLLGLLENIRPVLSLFILRVQKLRLQLQAEI